MGVNLHEVLSPPTHPLMKQLAIRLRRYKTAAKSLVNPNPPLESEGILQQLKIAQRHIA